MSARKSISTRERVRLFTMHGGTCHICSGRIKVGEAWDVEHVVPLALGGADDDGNRHSAHIACHRLKTKGDVSDMARAKRREAQHLGARAPSRHPLPFGRNSKFRKKINGEVVAREHY